MTDTDRFSKFLQVTRKLLLTQISTLISEVLVSVHGRPVRSRSGSSFVQRERASSERCFVDREGFRSPKLRGLAASTWKEIANELTRSISTRSSAHTRLYAFLVTLVPRDRIR